MQKILVTVLLALGISINTAAADSWVSGEGGRGAWSQTERGGTTLRISCWANEPSFFFTLVGGPFNGMKNIDDQSDSMMMWIEQSDGRTGRHPIDGHYVGYDKTFVGRFIVSDLVLEEFRNGSKIMLTASNGAKIAEFGMKGTGKARGHFKQGCKI